MLSFLNDIFQAARGLLRARAFTALCVTSLGVGMGVVIGVLLLSRLVIGTPPGVNDHGLVELIIRPTGALRAQAGNAIIDAWSYPDYLDVRDSANGMVVTGWTPGEALVRLADQPTARPVPTMYVSSNYFSTVGAPLALGRGFTAADDASLAPAEAVIEYRVWQLRFGSDPNIIGRSITINGADYVIVGVAPDRYRGHISGLDNSYFALWLPLSRHPRLTEAQSARLDRNTSWVNIVARLSPGTTLAQADATVAGTMATLAERYPSSNKERIGGAEPYFAPGVRKRSQITFARMMMLGLSGMVLLVVGLNLSGMMLARSAMRERELAIRLAIGAGRWRLVRHHLSEALVMAILGGTLAAALLFGVPIVVAWAYDFTGPALDVFKPDVWLFLQCILLCFVTSVILGFLPALRFSRPAIIATLKSDSAGSGRRVGRLQRLTAAAQAGLAVPFIVIGGIKIDQARATVMTDLGFNPKGLYAAQINLGVITKTEEEQRLLIRNLQENLAHGQAIRPTSVADGIPLDFHYRNTRLAPEGTSTFVTARATRVGTAYLETVGIRLLAGRTIESTDNAVAERVVLLSEPLSRELFPGGDALGKRVVFALSGNEQQTYTVVGITGDVVATQMGDPQLQLFIPLAQHPAPAIMAIARATPSDPSMRHVFENALSDAVRQAGIVLPPQSSGQASPDLGIGEVLTGEGLIDNSHFDILTHAAVSGGAASVALVLAALGVYGVIAFMVATRTREIGVRVALGASRGRVLRDVLGDALKLVVPGIAVGLVLSVLWVRLADPSWYPLGGVEPLVYTVAATVAFVVAALAGIPSARRAASVEPMIAMRAE